ncbi:MAG: FAD-dependent oxidoreductase [Planctomycetota bacterium]
MRKRYDVIVIGGGHAGCEAAWAAANLLRDRYDEHGGGGDGGRVAMVTLRPDRVGAMSCNPAIGGLAKGQIVREIDAMGGLMGLAADATGIQFRVLNASKGPAVRGPRCQSDKYAYAAEVQRLIATRPNLDVIGGAVEGLLVDDDGVAGDGLPICRGLRVRLNELDGPAEPTDACCGEFGCIDTYGKTIALRSDAVVLTTGTFMRGLMHTGDARTPGGRVGEAPASAISVELQRLGFDLGRLKTGTPPRLDGRTVDFAALELQPGDDTPVPFSEMSGLDGQPFPVLEQRPCHITHTSAASHDLIRANLDRAPMYNGAFDSSAGPRYCPSIEDKVVRFADRASHHVFLEPEGLDTHEVYCNGISTSLPSDIQDAIVAGLPGCEHGTILRYGYAVEYDMVWPHQIDATGMTKRVAGLLLAGQINGTSGYEEAAAQGLVAGVNAVRWRRAVAERDGLSAGRIVDYFDRFTLGRDRAYIGVLMDDLVTKTPREPYRMFTSRAEHRLMLRSDNAPQRLTPLGRELGLVDDPRWSVYQRRATGQRAILAAVDCLGLSKWARQPGRTSHDLLTALGPSVDTHAPDVELLAERVLADLLYAGYIDRHRREAERLAEREHRSLPTDLDYAAIPGLRTEAGNTLSKFRPATLGQACRLAGVTPADLMIVSIAMHKAEAAS